MSIVLNGTGGTITGVPGQVLQVVYGSTGTFTQTNSSTPADTTLSATITPTSSSSKILVIVSQNGVERSSSSTTNGANLYLVRNSTTLTQWTLALGYSGSALTLITNSSVNYLDSPATTSAITYKTQCASYNNSGYVRLQSNSGDLSTMTLMEIAA